MWYSYNVVMYMKNKTLLVSGMLLFILMFILLNYNLVDNIDLYSKNIQTFFSHSYFKTFFLFITNIMSVLGVIVILVFTSYLLRNKDKRVILLFITSILSCLLITNLIKIIIRRDRPIDLLLDVTGYSFPSSHSSISMVVYGFLILLLRKYYTGKRRNLYIGLCVLFILLTGLSRIIFNVHYISDVIAGFGLGLFILCISNIYLKKLTK